MTTDRIKCYVHRRFPRISRFFHFFIKLSLITRCPANTTWCVSFTQVNLSYRLRNFLFSMMTRKWKQTSPLVRCSIGYRAGRDSNVITKRSIRSIRCSIVFERAESANGRFRTFSTFYRLSTGSITR